MRRLPTRRAPRLVGALCGAALAWAPSSCAAPPPLTLPLVDAFDGPAGVVARPHDDERGGTTPWRLTSGTLFRADGTGWTGPPDDGAAPGSNGSAVFRMVSRREAVGDVVVGMRLRLDRWSTTARTPAQDIDGAHVWIRYRSPEELYAVSVDRRDGTMVVKKKCPGGPSNGGTYHDLDDPVPAPVVPGRWQQVRVTVRDTADGSVEITAERDGTVVRAVDGGVGCEPLAGRGAVGLRGDNAELHVDDVDVRPAPPVR
ncbi:hypothetical protein [Pseudonocardia endophytica]|uniref:3-keto-disaccharide hydrolase domain-containing protein n=1 Tax=Pseudonocardia endophytica TaxID=401976 RepID=A0A4R1HU06_PSEEN|nr:hypothetical protein [Pseudonocardia endophytica]TCK20912.1 hypothetical protein EV378_4878 [Pseudonocardia endophytica]